VKPKQIGLLAQEPDESLFLALSEGMARILENADRLWMAAESLNATDTVTAGLILQTVAEEEAAKYLMLLDAARCERSRLGPHLGRFYSHLARGLYVEACHWRTATYAEHLALIDSNRRTLYLDGPNDVDWIFRNSILSQREDSFYVDYVESEDGRRWLSPADSSLASLGPDPDLRSDIIDLVHALDDAGYSSPSALSIVADTWRVVVLPRSLHHAHIRELALEVAMGLT